MNRTSRTPSPGAVVLVGVAIAVAVNLATDLVEVRWRWWPVACVAALVLLVVVAVRIEVGSRRSGSATGGSQALWHQVPPRLRVFTGRRAELGALHRLASRRHRHGVRVVVVHGMGGVGKSSLVAEYAHQHRNRFALVWWISAGDRSSVVASMSELAGELGRGSVDPEQAATAALRALAAEPRRWLLVIDDVRDAEQIDCLLPTGGHGLVIITSRDPRWQHIAQTLEVDLLSAADAERLLRAGTHQSGPGVAALAERLGRLPLALGAVAQYCDTTRTPVETLTGVLPQTVRGTMDPICQPSLEHLRATNPDALDLLRLLACLAPGESPRGLISAARESLPDGLRRAVDADPAAGDLLYALRSVGLVQVERDGDPWMHELVQEAVRADAARPGGTTQPDWLLVAVRLLAAATTVEDDHTFDRWPWMARLARHAHAVLGRCDQLGVEDRAVGALRLHFAAYLFDLGERARARELRHQAAAGLRRLLPPDDPALADALDALGRSLRLGGDLKQAQALSREAYAITTAVLPPGDRLALRVQNGLAGTLFRQGEFLVALELRERTVAQARTALGEDDPWYWVLVNELALILRFRGETERALELRKTCYQAMLRLLGEDHPRTQTVKNDLAITLWDHGDVDEARRLIEDAYERRRRLLGPDNVSTLVSLSNLAWMARLQGDHDAAMRMDQQVYEVRMRELGHDDLTTLITIAHMAQGYALMGDHDTAERHHRDVYESRDRILGPKATSTLMAATELANFLTRTGRYEQAAELHRATLATRLKQRGRRDRGVATSCHGLGLALLGAGDVAGAREKLEEALAIRLDLFGEKNRYTLETRAALDGLAGHPAGSR